MKFSGRIDRIKRTRNNFFFGLYDGKMQKQRLGKGLGALIANSEDERATGSRLTELPVGEIRPNPYQPRMDFDPVKIRELAESIQEKGILQPLIVSKKEDGYELVVGERRLRAANRAGLTKVPCILMDVSEKELIEIALVENLQRDDLDPIEEAQAYALMIERFHLSQSEVAQRVGKDRSSVTNSLRLLRLPEPVRKLMREGKLTAGHARTLLGMEDPDKQVELAQQMVVAGTSVREAEENRRKQGERKVDPRIRKVEEELQRFFGTLVKLRGSPRGSITIRYYSLEDLNRILEILGVDI